MKKLAETFGQVLISYRTGKGWTQQRLADLTGLDRANISELENGKLIPSLETVFRLAQELKVTQEEFVREVSSRLRK